MAASTLAITYAELRRWIGREIGASRDPSSPAWSSIAVTDVGDALKAGLRQFYWPPNGHIWSFLAPTQAQLEVHGAYATGTVAVSSGVVTLSGGTFPSWAASADLWVDGGYYPVNTRDSNTQVTLVDTSVTGLSGESYSLKHREYDLADDFDGLLEPFTYRSDMTDGRPLTRVNEATLRSLDANPERTGPPEYFCITSVAPTTAQESKARAIFYPLPDEGTTYALWYRYSVVPPALDGSTYVYGYGSVGYQQTLLLSCLDQALQMLYGSAEKHGAFLESLEASTRLDKRKSRPDTYGFGSYSDGYARGGLDFASRREWARSHSDTNLIL